MRRVACILLFAFAGCCIAGEAQSNAPGGSADPRLATIFANPLAAGLSRGATVPISVVNGATFNVEQGLSSNTFGSIFGAGFAPATASWDVKFVDGVAPTELEGIEVKVNGKKSPIAFVLRGADVGVNYDQVNFVMPDDDAVGDVEIKLEKNGESTGSTMFKTNSVAPSLFQFEPEGRRYIAAVHADGIHVGKDGLFGGSPPTRPAKPNDVIQIFATGFGKTNPAFPAGTIPQPPAETVDPVQVFFGETPATVAYAGLSSYVALYQINVIVPNVSPGDIAVTAEIAGRRTQPNVYLTIAQE